MTISDGRPIDPFTSTVVEEREPNGMTEEWEAGKLFMLFSRLERSGALLPSQNPIGKGMNDEQ